jgi:sugar phosphate isomerase/epimerase
MMAAMGATGVKLFKLGYQFYHPRSGSYQNAFDQLQRRLFGWQRLAEKHGVAVCYHTHCGMDGFALGHHMGCNAAALAHLLQDIDPRLMGAYLDPGNMSLSGESFAFGAHIARNWLMAVGLQDVYVTREANADEGGYRRHWVSAGQGAVPWSNVFDTLREIEFQGLLPIHAEYEHVEIQDIESSLKQEVDYFRRKIQCQQQPMNKTEKPA